MFLRSYCRKIILTNAAKSCVEALYGSDPSKKTDLNVLRYKCFYKGANFKSCKLASLPPTKEALDEHSLRVYLQVQKWLNDTNKDPVNYGWTMTSNGLEPVKLPANVNVVPEALLKIIACGCQKNCSSNKCSCRKYGIKCTMLCKHCNGIICSNCEIISNTEVESEDDEVFELNQLCPEPVNLESNDEVLSDSSDSESGSSSVTNDDIEDLLESEDFCMYSCQHETYDTEDDQNDQDDSEIPKKRMKY